jgi:hypothetical protein
MSPGTGRRIQAAPALTSERTGSNEAQPNPPVNVTERFPISTRQKITEHPVLKSPRFTIVGVNQHHATQTIYSVRCRKLRRFSGMSMQPKIVSGLLVCPGFLQLWEVDYEQ